MTLARRSFIRLCSACAAFLAPKAVPQTKPTRRFDRGAVSAAELIAAVSARLPVIDLAIEEPEIEGIIARIYREGL